MSKVRWKTTCAEDCLQPVQRVSATKNGYDRSYPTDGAVRVWHVTNEDMSGVDQDEETENESVTRSHDDGESTSESELSQQRVVLSVPAGSESGDDGIAAVMPTPSTSPPIRTSLATREPRMITAATEPRGATDAPAFTPETTAMTTMVTVLQQLTTMVANLQPATSNEQSSEGTGTEAARVTTRKLVKQASKPTILKKWVDKATEIDDPMDSVAQGMLNIGQAWATAPSRYIVPIDGTRGQTNVIPRIPSGTGIAAVLAGGVEAAATAQGDMQAYALFTNPQPIYNKYSGTWEPPPGHLWSGKYWNESRRSERERLVHATDLASSKASKMPVSKVKRSREVQTSNDEEPDELSRPNKIKAAVKQTKASDNRKTEERPGRKPASGQGQHMPQVRTNASMVNNLFSETQMLCVRPAWSYGKGVHRL
ncbi:unnamed protein product [Phytophthora fragariaefolia]|uniref:Unnamed protein product n=1 Tax=Phytophthora fragariaefolia TaxID=1490495 RepID=A0A9W6TV50_9STRA|nr:unnamed protein product [Phytophthora fragariaefolia]